MRHLDPEHTAAGLAHGRRQAVDRRDDVASGRHHREPNRVVHKGVLRIDDGKRRLCGVEIGERVLNAATLDHSLHDCVGDGCAVQFHASSTVDYVGVGASG